MRRLSSARAMFCALLALGALAAGCGDDTNTSTAAPATPLSPTQAPATSTTTVTIPQGASTLGDRAFGEGIRAVNVNTQVTWVNKDSMDHTVTSDDGIFNSGTLAPGKSFSFVFSTPGDYKYHCQIHPSMKGTIRVSGMVTD